ARRRATEKRAGEMPKTNSLLAMTLGELREVLCQELERLPEKYRAPLVLCYLEGQTHEQAARQLGWSRGAIRGRLNRGRELLRGRLSRRGLALPMGLLTTALAVSPAGAELPSALAEATLQGALAFGAGQGTGAGSVSPSAAALAEEGVKGLV